MAQQTNCAVGAKLNPNYRKLAAGYLFPEINRRVKEFIASPKASNVKKIIRLGIGDTKLPLTSTVIEHLHNGVDKLSRPETYTGYGVEQGSKDLRKALTDFYWENYSVCLEPEEIFISDGAKCDSGNIQSIFDIKSIVAVQDPAYPVYVDTNVASGRSGAFDPSFSCYSGIVYMPCNRSNGFFPNVPEQHVDLIYICSPNNPTGAVATNHQLEPFVRYAMDEKAIIIFDSAYSMYIKDPSLPKSIYKIDGAKECAIEISSFSKWAGFTGVRLGWTIVPKALVTADSKPGDEFTPWSLWDRRQCTFFNGASNIAQDGGLGVLTEKGIKESQELIDFYMENARILSECFRKLGFEVYGGTNSPFLWIKTPNNMKSWEFFDKMLEEANVVITPGSGFGPSGEGYFRVSSFGIRENILEGVEKIESNLIL
ncbi:MAG: LL-diaminopimelate aminotransferase [Candidatus Micrarchaeota archaeon]|nr:LL-diaminopimelate aminotransferase [Candidatus Micrarchaeota archaeon]